MKIRARKLWLYPKKKINKSVLKLYEMMNYDDDDDEKDFLVIVVVVFVNVFHSFYESLVVFFSCYLFNHFIVHHSS